MDLDFLVTIKVRLLNKKTGLPLTGPQYEVKLFDEDIIKDDFLGEAVPDAAGNVSIRFDPKDIKSADSPLEEDPDLYFVILKNREVIYKSNIVPNLKLDKVTAFSFETGRIYDMGTFLIEE